MIKSILLIPFLICSANTFAKQTNGIAKPECDFFSESKNIQNGFTSSSVQTADAALLITNENMTVHWHTSLPAAGIPVNFYDSSFTSSGSAIVGWTWDFGDNGPLSYSQNPLYTYSSPGLYMVTLLVTSADGNQSVMTNTIEVEPSDSIARFGFSNVQSLPNPNEGHFILLLPGASSEASIFIADSNGNIIRKEDASNKKEAEFFLDLPKGIYLIEYRNEEKRYFQKIQIGE